MRSLKLRPLLSFLELLNSGCLTWLFLLRISNLHLPWNRSSKFFFWKKRIPTGTFFVIPSHTIYDVYHSLPQSTTLSSLSTSISSGVTIPRQDSLNKRSVQKIVQSDRSVQAKAEEVKSLGISADQCMFLMNVTSNLSDLIPLSKWRKRQKIAKTEKTNNTQRW